MKSTRLLSALLILAAASYVFLPWCVGQTAATGALTGIVTDPTAARVPGAEITVTNEATGEKRTVISGLEGTYTAPLLPPGSYRVEATKSGFAGSTLSGIPITVAETTKLNIPLKVGAATEKVSVSSEPELLQAESSALGRVVDEKVVTSLPLVTRNYTQIIGLSPGVTADVNNAGDLGRGSGGISQVLGGTGRIVVHGARSYDNNFQMNGIGINDFESNAEPSGGISIPNPDTIQEFKVQTGQYDAAFGRNAGANVDIVTRGGGNEFHGTAFEFFRNEALNANDFFFNLTQQRKPILRQNQFGGTLGGPIKGDKLFFFGSYQGTRQVNGLANSGISNCRSSVFSPPLTNDRSAAALGSLFAGQTGAFGGIAVAPDGSNINPIALKLLQMKLPDGTYLMKTPQVIDPTQPFASQGFSAFSVPCTFNEDQYMINVDYVQSPKSKFSERFFSASSDLNTTMAFANVPGFPKITHNDFRDASLAHTYVFGPHLLNEVQVGFHRVAAPSTQKPAFKFSDVGIHVIPDLDPFVFVAIVGSYSLSSPNLFGLIQNNYTVQDSLSYTKGRHTLRFGGGLTRTQDNLPPIHPRTAGCFFLSFPDFLIGLDGPSNGTPLGNCFLSAGQNGLTARNIRLWDGFAYLQDDFKIWPRLTLNLGARYERIGALSDDLGRDTNFYLALANPNPPAGGTLQGFVVPSNYSGGAVPAGVTKLKSNLFTNGDGQNKLAPRVGLAWQVLPNSSRFVLRAGYGIYYSRPLGNTFTDLAAAPPFALTIFNIGNPLASFQNPFPQPFPPTSAFPIWFPYSPTTGLDITLFAPDYQPPIVQQYSLNTQTSLGRDFALEVGYVGSRGTKLLSGRTANQAELASPSNPIRGVTTNTVANISQRVPVEGFTTIGLRQFVSTGYSLYNGLEASLRKRFSKGLQFLASYTWSKSLDTDAAPASFSLSNLGDQNNHSVQYGRSQTDRPHRLVVSYLYEFPIAANRAGLKGKVLGGWAVAGVTTFQSGQALSIEATNANNAFGITDDRAQLAPGCTNNKMSTPGPVNSKLNNYFNKSCLTKAFPVIGDDGVATGFGNSGVGILNGPDQRNFDISIIKHTHVRWPSEQSNVELRAEFFNAFNTTQFANPDANFSSTTFGHISTTAVNPRIIQFGLKFNF